MFQRHTKSGNYYEKKTVSINNIYEFYNVQSTTRKIKKILKLYKYGPAINNQVQQK